jgi:hypothetical protein
MQFVPLKKQRRETETVAMIPISYRPSAAGWLVLHGTDTILCRDWSTPGDVDALWRAVNSDDPVQTVLDLLTEAGLSRTPSFALIRDTGAATRVIARGAVVALTDSAGEHTMDGTGVSTWKEETWGGPSAIAISWDVPPSEAVPLPLGFGAAFASSVESQAAGALATPTTVAAPASTTTTASTPAAETAPADTPSAENPAAQSSAAQTAVEDTPPAVAPTITAPPAASASPAATLPPAPAAPEPLEADDLAEQTWIPEATMVSFEAETEKEPAKAADTSAGTDSDETDGDGGDYSFLFGQTVMRSVEDAAHREPEEGEDAEALTEESASGPQAGDHDGHTVHMADIAKLRAKQPKAPASSGPKYFVEISTGGQAELDGPVIIGRSPSSNKVTGGAIPQLVSLSGVQDISRNHVQFTVEGDTVVVTDLHSRNGTSIMLPGKSPQTLRAGEPAVVLAGTVVDLGGVTLTVKER